MLDRAKSKNNIAENLFALGHETHNRISLRDVHLFLYNFAQYMYMYYRSIYNVFSVCNLSLQMLIFK